MGDIRLRYEADLLMWFELGSSGKGRITERGGRGGGDKHKSRLDVSVPTTLLALPLLNLGDLFVTTSTGKAYISLSKGTLYKSLICLDDTVSEDRTGSL